MALVGVSDDAVWRALRREGIQLRRHRSWCANTDPEFAAKAADVIPLYLNPPQNALVLSVDEKSSIQALERARGYVQTSSGKIVQGLKSTCKRHGKINLLRNAGFRSTEQLIAAIHDFTAAYNQNAAPFVWRKREVRGAQLRTQLNTRGTVFGARWYIFRRVCSCVENQIPGS